MLDAECLVLDAGCWMPDDGTSSISETEGKQNSFTILPGKCFMFGMRYWTVCRISLIKRMLTPEFSDCCLLPEHGPAVFFYLIRIR